MRLVPFGLLVCALFASACSRPGATGAGEGDATPALRIGQETVTVGQLDTWIKDELFDRETDSRAPAKLYEVRASAAENFIAQRLLDAEAKRLGTDTDTLLELEAKKRMKVSDEEVQRFYDDNKKSFGDRPMEDMKRQIRDHLERRAAPEAARGYVQELRDAAGVEILLERPRTQIAESGGPAQGPADAPVTIVEFSDYQCPFCRRAEPTVQQVLQKYEGKVRFVFRHFPLDRIHPQARGASEAAACAAEQGKFWEYHHELFAANGQLDRPALDAAAQKTGLDAAAFKECVDSRKTQALVEADVKAGEAAGVSGTPAFFINGIPLRGALPLEEFQKVIDEELAEKAKS